jgi:hypothetical protein
MITEKFIASVQYGDWKGTSAADDAGKNTIRDWLRTKNLMKSDEYLLGVSIYASESLCKDKKPIYVNFLIVSLKDHDSVKEMINSSQKPVKVRKVSVDMNLTEFFGFFKRFSIAFSFHYMLGERDYTYVEE